MKRLFLTVFVLFCTIGLFAEKYTVKETNGNVTYKTLDKYNKVVPGMELDDETYVNVSVQAHLIVVNSAGKEITIKSASKGTVSELVIKYTTFQKSSLKKSTIAKAKDIAPDGPVRKGVATAASRASEAKEDFNWEE